MHSIYNTLEQICKVTLDIELTHYEQITGSGSNRQYFRLFSSDKSYIGVYNENIPENETFLYFSSVFKNLKLNTPEILAVSDDQRYIIQSDIGKQSLLEAINENPDITLDLYKSVLDELFKFQFKTSSAIDYSKCFMKQRFDSELINWDLNYCKYYFLKVCDIELNEVLLQKDFNQLVTVLLKTDTETFLYRDFQARNIFIENNKPYFIDYQGGMKGSVYYDVASLLFQSRAKLSPQVKNELSEYYFLKLQQSISIDREEFNQNLNTFVLLRMLQNLGAYGFRGKIEKKELFLQSIPEALETATQMAKNINGDVKIPYLTELLDILNSDKKKWEN